MWITAKEPCNGNKELQEQPQDLSKTTRKKINCLSSTKRVVWNLEEEIAKVIDKGVALGVNFKKNKEKENLKPFDFEDGKEGEKDATDTTWNLEEEVTKVIQMGVALGIDFNGIENEMIKIIDSREEEDDARMEEAEHQ